MSNTIDERVLEMRFDNKQFESGVATSMSTLDKLKQKLNLTGASKGLEDLSRSSKNVDFSGMSSGIETVNAKFSAMQVIGMTALANITNSAVNCGKRMISALTIDPVKSGFQEYETQLNAVQTILANTQKEGTNVEIVNAALDELNAYADKTIYNFTEMTRNIGTFTAAGVKLDTSVSAIQGIANLAAVSGSTSQQASTAMYQLSQALAAGTVKLMDWNSVVNAGMGGQVFQDALKETSVLLGTGADAAIEAAGSFRESLSTGWLTAEVLTETLKKFTTSGANEYVAEYTGLSKEAIEAALEEAEARYGEAEAIDKASEALANKSGKNKDEIKSALEFAKTAEDAATKVKTFTQLIDTLQEALGSGWAKTWQIIIGDFEEAKELWTNVSDVLSGFINKMSDARNELLDSALGKSFSNLGDAINKVLEPAVKVEETVSEVSESLENLDEIVSKVIRGDFGNGQERIDKLTESGQNYMKVQNKVNETLGNGFRYTQEQIEAQDKLIKTQDKTTDSTTETKTATSKLTDEQKKNLKALSKLTVKELEQLGYTDEQIKALQELKDTAEKLGIPFDDFIDKLDEINGRWLLIESFKNIGRSIVNVFSSIGTAFQEVFDPIKPEQIFDAIGAFHKLTAAMIPSEDTCDKLTRTFKGLFSAIDLVTTIVGGGFKIAFKIISAALDIVGMSVLDATALIGDMVYKFNKWFKDNVFVKFVEKIIDKLPSVIDGIKDFISSLDIGESAAGSFKTVCEGVAAAIDIMYGKISRSLNTGLKVLGSILSIFGTNLAEVIVKIAEAIIQFRDWIKTNTLMIGGVNKVANIIVELYKGISNIVEAFMALKPVQAFLTNLKDTVIDFFNSFDLSFDSGFLDGILNGIKNVVGKITEWLGTLENSEHFGTDLVLGLINGITSGIGMAIEAIINLANSIISTFCDMLGIHSPATVAIKWGLNIIEGLIEGIKAGFGIVDDVVTSLAEKIMSIFNNGSVKISENFTKLFNSVKTIWTNFMNLIQTIDFKKVLAVIPVAIALLFAKKIWDLANTLADGIKGINSVIKGFEGIEKSFSKVLDSVATNIKAEAVYKIAKSIAILVGAVVVLANVDRDGLIQAMVSLVILAGVLAGLALVINKLDNASIGVEGKSLNINGLKTTLLQIGAAMLLVAASVKIMGSMKEDEFTKGFEGLARVVAAIGVVLIAFGVLAKMDATANIDKVGGMILKVSIAMILMVAACKLAAKLLPDEMKKGAKFAAGFAVFVMAMAVCYRIAGDNVNKLGSMILKLTIAMALMVGVCKLAGMLNKEEMKKGAAFAVGFIVFVAALKIISQIFPQAQMQKMAGMILSLTISLALMVGVCKLVSLLSPGEMIKGAAFAVGFIVLIRLLVKVTTIGSEDKIAKAAGTILAMSIAIGLMAGVCIILSLLTTDMLMRGVSAVAVFGLIVTAMIAATRDANDVKGSIMMMAVAIAVMAASVALLSFIKTEKLAGATAALGILMGMFVLIARSSRGIEKSMPALIVMSAAVGVLAYILYKLSSLDAETSIKTAAALSLLMIAMAAALRIVANVGDDLTGAIKGVIALTTMVVPLVAFICALKQMNGVENAMDNVKAISVLMITMTALLAAVSLIGKYLSSGIVTGLISLSAMFVPMVLFVEVLKQMDGIEDASGKIKSLVTMMTAMTLLLAVLAVIGLGGPAAVIGIASLIALFVAIGGLAIAIGYLMDKFPSIQKFLDTGLPILEQLAGSIGTMIGNFVSNLGEAIGDTLVKMGNDIAAFMMSLSVASVNASMIKGESFDGVKKLIDVMGDIALMTVGTTLSDIFTFGGTSMDKFQTDGVAFFDAMKEIGEASNGVVIDEESFNAVITAAQKLAELQSSLEPIGGVMSWFKGRDDLASFGDNAGQFFDSMKTAFTNLEEMTVDEEALNAVITAAQKLADLQSSLEPIGGVISWFKGRDDLASFGVNIGQFFDSMKTAFTELEGVIIDEESLTSIITAAQKLAELQSSLEPIGGVMSWFKGRDDLGEFGDNIGKFAEAIRKLKEGMGENGISEAVVTSITNTGDAIIALQNALPEESWFDGKMNLSEFSDYVSDFGTAMSDFSSNVSEINYDAMSTAINAAYRIKNLIAGLVDLDTSGLVEFTGIGTGGFGADGAAYKIAKTISTFSEEVASIDTTAVSTSVSVATRLKDLISSLVGLDTSGIENFKIDSIGSALKSYATSISDLNIENVSSSISAASRIRNFISSLAGLDSSGVSSFKNAINELASTNVSNLVRAFNEASGKLASAGANMINALISGLQSGMTRIPAIASSIMNSAVAIFSSKSGVLSSAGIAMINGLAVGLESGRSRCISIMTSLMTSMIAAVQSKSTMFSPAGVFMITGLAQGISSGKPVVIAAITSVLTIIITTIQSRTSIFTVAGLQLMIAAAKGMMAGRSIVMVAASSAASSAVSGIRSKYSSFYSAGVFLGSGLVIGINSMKTAAYNAGYALGQAAAQGEKDGQDSNSPSKLTIQAGKWLGEGLVIGIEAMGSKAYKAGYELGDKTANSISTAVSKVSDMIDANVDAEPTIRPVLDLSDIKSGASAMNSMLEMQPSVGVMANLGNINTMMNQRIQNGFNNDVVSAINKLRKDLSGLERPTYNINGITYDDGSNIATAMADIVRAANIERRR